MLARSGADQQIVRLKSRPDMRGSSSLNGAHFANLS